MTNRCGGWLGWGWEFFIQLQPWSPQVESLSRALRMPKPYQIFWRLIFSPWSILRSRQLLRKLKGRWGIRFKPCQRNPVKHTDEVQEIIRGFKVSKAPGPNGITDRALKHLYNHALSLLPRIFNALLRIHHFPQMWKHVRVISIQKPVKDPVLPASYRTISRLDAIGKLFEKILLALILHVVNERGLMRDEQFGFRLRYCTSLQLARFVERITRNFDEKRLTGCFLRHGQSLRYRLDRWPPLQCNAFQLPVLHSP